MRLWSDLLDKITGYHPNADVDLLNRIHARITQNKTVAAPKTASTLPASTLPSLPHDPLEVALILADLRLDVASIAAGLLVESISSQRLTLEQARTQFGEDVAFLLEGISKIGIVSSRARVDIQIEDFRKMILAMAKDIRVILVRLGLCMQQARAAVANPELAPPRMARDILEIYSPIAHRLGIHWVMSELEDCAFLLQDPTTYQEVKTLVESRRQGGEDVVRKVVTFLKKRLRKYNIIGEISGREKHLYSVWSKTLRKGVSIDDLYDLIAYRIIVRKKSDCYRVLGMIHSEMKPIPGRFKDYIALPKSNGYQSLHSAVIGPFGNRIEIQIRTQKMHEVAERGVAAHWCYKEGGVQSKAASATGYAWLQQLLEVHRNAEDIGQFLDNVRIDLFPDEIYVFSPKGDILTLPKGSTPVDFAYAIHSAVGDNCQGCKVNGRMVPLRTQLHTGDTIEIITGKNRTPSQNWLQFVVTSNAKYRISRWLRNQEREQFISLGRELLEREARKIGSGLSVNDKLLRRVAEEMRLEGPDDILFQIGGSRLSPAHVLHRMYPEQVAHEETAPAVKTRASTGKVRKHDDGSLRLSGILPDMVVHAARCCNPVPGDPIVGIITTGKGITLHVVGCPNLESLASQPERWIEDISWLGEKERLHTVRVRAMIRNDDRGGAAMITKAVGEAKGEVIDLHISDRHHDPCVVSMTLEVADHAHMEGVLAKVRGLEMVYSVERIQG